MAQPPGNASPTPSLLLQPFGQNKAGYRALATVMGPYRGLNIYKRFTTLNAYNLLIQQAELLHLESKLEVLAVTDAGPGLDYDTNALRLIESGQNGQSDEQWQTLLHIRQKLKDYYDDLLRQSQVAQLSSPRPYDLGVLREWIGSRKGGDGFLTGHEALPWTLDEEELVALSQHDHDSVTAYITEHLTPWYVRFTDKRAAPGHEDFGLVYCPDKPYQTTARVLAVLASTLIPSVAIVILYFITSLIVRLVTSMLLSLVFSTTLAVLTKARAAEIFASTAAFAAVQVVFIGSTSV